MALKTWVARFVVEHGRVTEEGGRLRTFQRRRLDEADVDLHILSEPDGGKGEDLGAQALDAVGRQFLTDRLSVTGGLLRSLQQTHHTLLDWNRRSLPGDQVTCGITAVAIQGPLVYLAQAGPGIALLHRNGRLSQLMPAELAARALGQPEAEPSVRRLDLQAGDVLIGASLALGRIIDEQTLLGLLARGSDEALPELYLMTRDQPNFALFAVTCSDEPDAAADPVTDSGFISIEDPLEGDLSLPPRQPLAEIEDLDELSERSAFEPDRSAVKKPETLMRAPPLDISKAVVKLRTDQAFGRSDYARTIGSRRPFRFNLADGKLLRFGVAAVLILLVIGFVPGLVREGRSEKLGDLVVASQTQLSAASGVSDPGEKRRLLEDSRRFASEALRLDSANASAADLRDQAAAAIRTLDGVIDLGAMTTVATLSRTVTGEISLDSLLVSGSTAYVLDTKGGRVLSVPIGGGQPTIAFQDGETYSGTPAKKPIYITWEGGTQNRLLILDTERKLFEMKGTSPPSPLALRRTNTWGSVAGISAYDGNFYVLDPKSNQVHRYLPAAAGFDSEPTPVLTGSRDLANGAGLTVDGDIYVYAKDGKIKRFRSGAEGEFPIAGIDRPIRAATDFVIVSKAEEAYISDSGNKRIVVSTRDGTFRRQYVSNSFTDIRAIAIDAAGTQLYALAGDTLLTAPITR